MNGSGTWQDGEKVRVSFVYKWAYDPDDALVYDDGSIKWRRGKLVASADDASAIIYARALTHDSAGQLTAITIGNGDVSWALSRGASGALSAESYMPSVDDAQTAQMLAEAVKAAGDADVVVLGDAQAFAGVAGVLGAELGLPLLIGVSDFALDPDSPNCIIAHRSTGEVTETIRVHTPAMLTVAAAGEEIDIPTIKETLAARKLPVDVRKSEDLGTIPETKMVVKESRIPKKRVAHILDGELSLAVDELVATLREKGVL
jgi:electron transfer flavoprotein beta subunit